VLTGNILKDPDAIRARVPEKNLIEVDAEPAGGGSRARALAALGQPGANGRSEPFKKLDVSSAEWITLPRILRREM
jgi:hypothetical protein